MCGNTLALKIFLGKIIDRYRLAWFLGGVGALEEGFGLFCFPSGNSSFLKKWFPSLRNQQGRERCETILFLHCFIHGVFPPRVCPAKRLFGRGGKEESVFLR